MKNILVYCLALGFVIMATAFTPHKPLPTHQPKPKKIKIMILSTYHMANPGLDVINQQADNVATPQRQKELEELAVKLARFKPTKIAVEAHYQSRWDTLLNEQYQNYRAHKHTLSNNEIEQIGFRLGKKLGHTHLYAIDEAGAFDFDKVMAYAQQNGQEAFLKKELENAQNFLKNENLLLQKSSVSQYLKHMNSASFDSFNQQFYQQLLKIGKNKEYVGSSLLAGFYERNLKIAANLLKVIEAEEERILVIYGAGHASFFKRILSDSQEYELVNACDYL